MSVYYNIVTKNRKRYPIQYICFGLLNRYRNICDTNFDSGSKFYKNTSYHSDFSDSPRDLVAIEYNYKRQIEERSVQSIRNRAMERYEEQVSYFLNSFDWVKSVAVLHKGLGIIRVQAAGVPADKVMFILTVIRNMTRNASDYAGTSNPERDSNRKLEELFDNPRERFIFSWLMNVNYYSGWGSNLSSWRCYPLFNDESNVLNSATFGKKALNRLIRGEEPEWYQEDFDKTECGYMRESHFEEEDITFGTTEDLSVFDDYDEYADSNDIFGNHGGFLYRTLGDSLSIEYDDPIFSMSSWDDCLGFVFNISGTSLETFVEQFKNAIEE